MQGHCCGDLAALGLALDKGPYEDPNQAPSKLRNPLTARLQKLAVAADAMHVICE